VSEANVELVRRAKEALTEATRAGGLTDALAELCDPAIQVDASRRVFNPEVYEGHAGMTRLVAEMSDAWQDFSHQTERLIDLGDRVLSIQTIAGRGRASGAEVDSRSGLIWTVRAGRITRVEVYGDHRDALAAAGLEA